MKSAALNNTRLVAALLAAGLIGGAGVGAFNAAHPSAIAAPTPAIVASGNAAPSMALPDFSQITERHGPAVVNISVTGTTRVSSDSPQAQGGDEGDASSSQPSDPMLEFFRRFQQGHGQGQGGRNQQEMPTRGQGSGFIVSADGVILTNAHVVSDAKEVTVKLTDRREFRAKVLGADTKTDVAVLKIEAKNLPVATLGKTSELKVGSNAPNAHQGPNGWVVPPNNWIALFGGPAWEWVPARGQFYYHKFYKQQPDLNFRNPAVEKATFDAMRFWLDRGVAGFRLDAITNLFEDSALRDEPIYAPGTNAQGDPNVSDTYTNMLPEVHDVMRRMSAMVAKYPGDRVLIGETYLPSTAAIRPWYGTRAQPELQLPMDMMVGFHSEGGAAGSNVALNLTHFRQTLTEMQTELDSQWPLLVFDNHDNTRSWDRFGDGGPHNPQIARIIATILYTSRATALTYFGAEIGMTTHTPTRRGDVRDPIGITGWPREKGRDGERTPMQWTSAPPAAGFSTNAHTWLPIGDDFPTVNVATETAGPNSLLNWTRTLIDLRRLNPAVHDGGIVMLDTTNPSVFSYARTVPTGSKFHPIVVSLNFTAEPQIVHLDLTSAGITSTSAKALLADAADLTAVTTLTTFTLPPYASLVAEVK